MTLKKEKIDTKTIFTELRTASLLILLILLNIIFTPNFFSINTLWNIVVQVAPILLVGLGMTVVIATGGIDISVGSLMAIASIVSVKMLDLGVVGAIIFGLVLAGIFGYVNGFVISRFNLQPIIVTLSLMITGRGIAQVINDGKLLNFSNVQYASIGVYKIGGSVPIQLVFMIIAVSVMYFVTARMKFGYELHALGDNRTAAEFAGINTKRIISVAYIICAVFAGFAGILETARISAADANSLGKLMELDAIASVAIGGTSMNGGKPKVIGTVIGACIIQLITVTINMNNIPYNYSLVLKSIIIILAVYFQKRD